jgi:hypothetical protein
MPFIPNDVPNLRKFLYNKVSGIIVQEKDKKVSVIGGNPISIITQICMTKHVSKYLVVIASTRSSFWNAT